MHAAENARLVSYSYSSGFLIALSECGVGFILKKFSRNDDGETVLSKIRLHLCRQ